MGPFLIFFGNQYILVVVDYVSKWVEAVPTRTNDNKIVVQFLKENVISYFGAPVIISDNESPSATHKLSTAYILKRTGKLRLKIDKLNSY